MREVCLRLPRRGFRAERIIVVTTLLDAKPYSAQQLTLLYGWRWQAAEINLRHLKTTLHMEMLSAKTPVMVRKEVWAHLLAYNLLRTVMEQAATKSRLFPLSTLCPRNPSAVQSDALSVGYGGKIDSTTLVPPSARTSRNRFAPLKTSSTGTQSRQA